MAGDWIKMRVNLVTHPKVINLAEELSYDSDYQDWSGLHGFVASIGGTKEDFEEGVTQALRVTRYVTVTALLKFWGYANEHAKGEFIPSLRIQDIDEIAQVPGFGSALESIGWAIYDAESKGIFLPNFSEHNATASDRGAAARQRRYREKKKTVTLHEDVTSDVTRDVTVTDREEKRREEKRRENKKDKKDKDEVAFDANAYLSNLDVDSQVIKDWLELRKQKKAKVTLTAIQGIQTEADKAFISLEDALRLCCRNGWQGFNSSWLKGQTEYKTALDKLEETGNALAGRSSGNGARSNVEIDGSTFQPIAGFLR